MVDARNTGEWTPCVNLSSLALPRDWVRKSHIGLSASTGQLADNHDVLSLLSYSDFKVMETEEAAQAEKKLFDVAPNLGIGDRLSRYVCLSSINIALATCTGRQNQLKPLLRVTYFFVNVFRLENAIHEIRSAQAVLDHHLEHELASVKDHIDTLVSKLDKREDKAETRITGLEEIVKKVLSLFSPN